MKPITMFTLRACPYCKQALSWMEEIKNENTKFANIDINIIDEALQPDLASQYDYYYVPTYYINGTKIHEGAASKDIILKVFESAAE